MLAIADCVKEDWAPESRTDNFGISLAQLSWMIETRLTGGMESWSCMQVASWLVKQDLDFYESEIILGHVDGPALLRCEHRELQSLGFHDEQDREKLLTIVAVFRGSPILPLTVSECHGMWCAALISN